MISEREVTFNGLKMNIRHSQELFWMSYIHGKLVCVFHYLRDQGKFWVNDISTIDLYQRKGCGEQMIKAALTVYPEIYFANAERREYYQEGNQIPGDSRYHNDEVLLQFADKLVKKKIILPEWIANPFKDFK